MSSTLRHPPRPGARRRAALLSITLLVGCGGEPTTVLGDAAAPRATPVRAAHRETAAERWVALTRRIVGRREAGPLGTARSFALVSVAQHDAVIAAGEARERGLHPSEAGAAAGAAAAVLRSLYPVESSAIGAQLAADAAFLPAMPSERDADFAAGVEVGERVAAAVLAHAATDRSDVAWTGTVPTGPGYWLATPAPPMNPAWARVRPWFMSSGDQFRPPPPPAFGSPAYAAALAEVRAYAANLTPEQAAIARFWQGGSGPGGPLGFFGALAAEYAGEHHLNERQSTRLFAVLYMAMMDASIGCWDAKYAYWYIRPHQADASIPTIVGRPPFPAYPSAHSCFSASAAGVLQRLFPARRDELQALVAEAGLARQYAGMHYWFDITAGQQLGYSVAALAIEHLPATNEVIGMR